MLKTAFQFVWSRKKSSLMLIAILSLSLALMLVISPLFGAVADSIFELYASRYGEQHGVFMHLTDEKLEKLRSHENVRTLGILKNYGSWQVKDTSMNMTLGYFDETAFSLGRLRLLGGRLPEANSEIVLEKNVLYKCKEGTGVGDRLSLSSGGVEKEFTIVGILADYTGYWDTFVNESVIEGYNDYPQALLIDQELGNKEPDLGCLLYLNEYSLFGGTLRQLSQELEGSNMYFVEDIIDNSLLYGDVKEGRLGSFSKFQQIFQLVILGGACLTMLTALALYLNNYKGSYSLLYTLGASRRYAGGVFAAQCAFTVLLSLPLSVLLAFLISALSQALMGESVQMNIFRAGNFLWPAAAVAAIGGLMYLRFRTVIAPLHEASLSELKVSKAPPQMTVKRHLLPSLSGHFLRSNFAKVVAVLLMMSMLVSALGIEQAYMYEFQRAEDNMPGFTIEAHNGYAAMPVPPFKVTNIKGEDFSVEDIAEIRAMEGVSSITELMSTQCASIVIPAGNAYWQAYASRSSDFWDGPSAEDIEGAPKNVITVTGELDFRIVLIEEASAHLFREAYPDLPLEDMRKNNSVALFLPPFGEGSSTLKNDFLKVGGQITFGRLEYPQEVPFSQLDGDPSSIRYVEIPYDIAYIADSPLRSVRPGIYDIPIPTIVMWAKTAAETPLVKGYWWLSIYLEKDISESAYNALEKKVIETAVANPSSRIYSAKEDQAQNAQFEKVLNTSLMLLFAVFGSFALLSVYSALYLALLSRKRSLAIYRAIGMRRRTLFAAILWELLFYWLFAILLAFAISMAVFAKAWGWIVLPEIGGPMMRVLLISLFAGLPISFFIVRQLLRSVYSESVCSAIRFE